MAHSNNYIIEEVDRVTKKGTESDEDESFTSETQKLLRQRGPLPAESRCALKKQHWKAEGPTLPWPSSTGLLPGYGSTPAQHDNVLDGRSAPADISSTMINSTAANYPFSNFDTAPKSSTGTSRVKTFLTDCQGGEGVQSVFDEGVTRTSLEAIEYNRSRRSISQPARSKFPKRTNSFTAHFAGENQPAVINNPQSSVPGDRMRLTSYLLRPRTMPVLSEFIHRRREALETERQEISVFTSPTTVLSYFVLYILSEFRTALMWIISQQYLLVVFPIVAALICCIYQTDGAHQPVNTRSIQGATDAKEKTHHEILTRLSTIFLIHSYTDQILKHAESGLIWYGYWTLLGIASSVGLGTGLHTFILFLGPHIAEVTLTAYKCGNTQFDVRGDHRYTCKSPEALRVPLGIYTIFQAVQLESFFWGLGTALGELPPYFVARAGNRNEELAAIEDLLKKKPDAVSYKERILLMVHEGMKRLGFFGIFLCASTLFVIFMFSADTLASFMSWLERSVPFIHGYLADGINSQKGALHGVGRVSQDELEDSTSLVGLIWNTIIFIMISYFLLSIVETMALAQIKRRHDQEIVELESKIRRGDTKALFMSVSEEIAESSQTKSGQEAQITTDRQPHVDSNSS
ncbi:Vacuolar membrane protease [Mortierella claussenii]|nr:Vacuolar membrane protease [Mortierella claussenii]